MHHSHGDSLPAERIQRANLDGGRVTPDEILAVEGYVEGIVAVKDDAHMLRHGGDYSATIATHIDHELARPAPRIDRLRRLSAALRTLQAEMRARALRIEHSVVPEMQRCCHAAERAYASTRLAA